MKWIPSLWLITLSAVTAGFAGEPEEADPPPALSHHPQLFLDDFLIAERQNLHRDVKRPVKDPRNPLIRQDRPWETRMIELYGTVLYDEGKFRCWYLASESPEASPEYYICYAESPDGLEWTKSPVGREKFGRHAEHNVVIPGGHGICILKTPDDPDPERRYKAAGGDLCGWSPDGIRWTTQNIRSAVGKNDTCTSFVRWNNEFLCFVRNQEPETGTTILDPGTGKKWSGVLRGVGLCVSKDFKTWTPKKSILRGDARDGFPWGQPHALCVTAYGDVLIGLLPMLSMYPEDGNNALGPMDVQLAVSRDGRSWQRVADRALFMPQDKSEPLAKRAWDARFHPGSTMLVKEDAVHIYYFGTKRLHGEKRVPDEETPYGIGRATLPADRFVSLRPVQWQKEGVLQTRLLRMSGRQLLVNADVKPDDLKVELLDARGQALPGFGREDCTLAVHDKLRFRVAWGRGDGARTLRDAPLAEPVALRFSLRDGDLYSFQVIQ